MKNIFKFNIVLVLVSALALASCSVDDDAAVVASNIETIEASFDNLVLRVPANSGLVNVPISLTTAVTQLARVTYTIDGGNEITQDINTGGLFANIEIDMDGFVSRQIQITNFQMLYENVENFTTTVSANNSVTVVNGDDVIIQMTWASGVDIDLALTNGNPAVPLLSTDPNLVDLSLTVTDTETVVLPAAAADGDYFVSIVPFAGFTTPIEFTTTVIADQVYTFTSTVDEGTAASGLFVISYSTVVESVQITKSGTSFTVTNLL